MAMKNACANMLPTRKKSVTHSVVDLRLEIAGATADQASNTNDVAMESKMHDSPRQPTMSLPSEALVTESVVESTACESTTKDGSNKRDARAHRSGAAMRSFLQRVMRSQSDSHIRIAPLTHVEATSSMSREVVTPRETTDEASDNGQLTKDGDEQGESKQETLPPKPVEVTEPTRETDARRDETTATLCDVFLNSSLQLLQVQNDAKQRVRQLWTCAQKLRWDNQLSDTGLESLHQELLAVMKALTVEKLDGPRHVKAGYLTLVQAPPAVVATNLMQRGVAAATKSLLLGGAKMPLDQRMWVSLSEEQCRMELVPPTRSDATQPPGSTTDPNAPPSTLPAIGKFKLPTSISWLLSDPMQGQGKDEDTAVIGRTSIKLQGCQVRLLPVSASGPEPPRVRFQLLVPNTDPSLSVPVASSATVSPGPTAVVPDASAMSAYGAYVFEIPLADVASAEIERDEWMHAIDRVCVFPLYALENQLRDACYMLQFRDLLAMHFPVCVPLTWLRNRLEKITATGTMSPQQHANYQYQQLQRRSSRNLSMIQIVKDLERDRILVDRKLLISCTGAIPGLEMTDSTIVERDSVAEIVKYLVGKAMAFSRNCTQATKPTKSSPVHGKPPVDPQGLMSPSNRLSKFTEARALAFVERVLRGSSRTQSGGDIYDAISFFCQHRNLMICPMSQDAHPVQLNVVEDEDPDDDSGGAFHIEIEVSMQFKVVEMPAMTPHFDDIESDPMAMASPREWAVLEGTLRRQFTLGKLSEPGSVTLTFIPDADCPNETAENS